MALRFQSPGDKVVEHSEASIFEKLNSELSDAERHAFIQLLFEGEATRELLMGAWRIGNYL